MSIHVAIVAAMASNRVIGVDNRLPWHVSEDLRRFKSLTLGKPVIMGRKTHESIGKALPSRENIVVTRNPGYSSRDALVRNSLEDAIELAIDLAEELGVDEVSVIGGEEIFRACLGVATKMYITLINRDFSGDAMFPEFDESEWRLSEHSTKKDPDHELDYEFKTFVKNHARGRGALSNVA